MYIGGSILCGVMASALICDPLIEVSNPVGDSHGYELVREMSLKNLQFYYLLLFLLQIALFLHIKMQHLPKNKLYYIL